MAPEGEVVAMPERSADPAKVQSELAELLSAQGSEAVMLLNAIGEAIEFSPNWQHVGGYEISALCGMRFADRIHPDCRAGFEEARILLMRGSGPLRQEIVYSYLNARNRWRWHAATMGRMPAGSSVPEASVFAVIRDVTELVEQEQEIERYKGELELAKNLRREFLSHMNHELRTPLNAILGFSEMMQTQMLGPLQNIAYREYLDDIRQSGNQLLEVVKDLLELASIENGEQQLDEEETNLTALLAKAIQIKAPEALRRDVTIRERLFDCPVIFKLDPNRMRQALSYLLDNAVLASPPGGVIEIEACFGLDGSAIVSILDTGRMEDRVRLIHATGTQIKERRMRQQAGPSVGTALAREFAGLHGGSLSITAKPQQQGTMTVLTLPALRLLRVEDNRAAA